MSNQSSSGIKALAIAGFILFVGLLVWLAVTLVGLLPNAFSSLASLADGLQQARPQSTIVVANSNSIVNSGDTFTISWTGVNRSGQYTIRYECVNGVAVDMRFPANNITPIPCGQTIKLGSDVTSLELTANSERQRFIDINYTISFVTADDTAVAATDGTVTIVNVSIPQSQSADAATDDATDTEPAGDVADKSIAVTDTDDTTDNSASQPPAPTTPSVVATEIFELPTSDPDGFVDLAVTYRDVGRLTPDNTFVSGGVIETGTRGAFQFEVRNLGTKTSADWTFAAELTSGSVYESDAQPGLLPNEYSIVTVGFDTVGTAGAQRFGAEINAPGDRNSENDRFSWAVNVIE